jgi:hypothetical protein
MHIFVTTYNIFRVSSVKRDALARVVAVFLRLHSWPYSTTKQFPNFETDAKRDRGNNIKHAISYNVNKNHNANYFHLQGKKLELSYDFTKTVQEIRMCTDLLVATWHYVLNDRRHYHQHRHHHLTWMSPTILHLQDTRRSLQDKHFWNTHRNCVNTNKQQATQKLTRCVGGKNRAINISHPHVYTAHSETQVLFIYTLSISLISNIPRNMNLWKSKMILSTPITVACVRF